MPSHVTLLLAQCPDVQLTTRLSVALVHCTADALGIFVQLAHLVSAVAVQFLSMYISSNGQTVVHTEDTGDRQCARC
jgi:hypothetical protein